MIFESVVARDPAAMLGPRGKGIDEREGWVRDGSILVYRGVRNPVHFGQCLGEGRYVMVLEEVLIWHVVSRRIVDGDGG